MMTHFRRRPLLPAISLLAGLCGCQEIDPQNTPATATHGRTAATPEPCVEPGDPAADAFDPATGPGAAEKILPNGRALTPTGLQVKVGTFPMNVVVSPDSRYAFITNNGYSAQSIMQLDLASNQVVATLAIETLFNGLVLSADGKRLYAAGGGSGLVHAIAVNAPGLTLLESWNVGGYPTGLALSPDGNRLLVTANLGGEVLELDPTNGSVRRSINTGLMPYQVAFGPDGTKAYVTDWRDGEVAVIDITRGRVVDTLDTDKNPSGLLFSRAGDRLFVTSSDGDLIEAFDPRTNRLIDDVPVGSFAEGMHGVSPNAMALSKDGALLFVANAGDNAVEVYEAATLQFRGAIPTGWYPSALAVTPDGTKLLVANGKGEGAGPNPQGRYSPTLMGGTLSIVPLPLTSSQLTAGDAQVITNNQRPMSLHEINCAGKLFPIPSEGMESPIKHVFVIMRENKTYDAVLGDLEVGNGDPDLTLFPEQITPNLHQLAREFTVLDNFYTDSEVSVQGHLWATASFVNDYTERTWIEGYRSGARVSAQGVGTASDPKTRYIFDHLWNNGIDWINYGEIVGFGAITWKNIDLNFPGVVYNLNIKDEVKAEYVADQIRSGVMAPFTFLLLPNDHTNGTQPGKPTPESMVADNDYGTGIVVDAISKSPFWESTVIFIFEDDTQIGADHVEAHRSPAVVVSPWTKRGHVSSVLYSIPSLFTTFERILGMPPLTQYDALATPMYDVFTAVPDLTPYDVIPRQYPEETNREDAFMAEESMRMDFSRPDQAKGLGKLLWRYIKRTEPPLMLGFQEEEEEEDEEEEALEATWRFTPEE